MHEAHVPLEAEAEAADLGRGADERVGCGFLGNGDDAGIVGQYRVVEFAQEIHRAEVDVAALAVGRVFAVAAAVVEVEHGADRVHADAVDVVLLEKFAGRGDQEALHLVGGIVEDQRAPLGVVGHALLLALELRAAVETGQAVLVLGEVRRHPVHDQADAVLVELVHQIAEIVGVAVAGGGGVVARHLVAPGAVVGVFRDRQELDMGEAHVPAVVGQLVGDLAVYRAEAGQTAPGADVHLIDAHRRGHEVPFGAPAHIVAVGPGELAVVEDDGGRLARVLAEGREGVGLQDPAAVAALDADLVAGAVPHAGHEGDPAAAGHLLHGRVVPVPAVEITDDGHTAGVRRPDQETVQLQLRDIAAAEAEPGLGGVAGVEQVDIVRGDIGQPFAVHEHAPLYILGLKFST